MLGESCIRGDDLTVPKPEGGVAKPGRVWPKQTRVGDGIDPKQRPLGHAYAAGDQSTIPQEDIRGEGNGLDRCRPAMDARAAEVDAVSAERAVADVDCRWECVDQAADFAVAPHARTGESEPMWPEECAIEPALRRVDELRHQPQRHVGGAPAAH